MYSPPDSGDEPTLEDITNISTFRWDCGGLPATFRVKTPRRGELEDFLCRIGDNRSAEDVGCVRTVFGVQTKGRSDTEHFSQLLCGLSEHVARLTLSENKAVKRASANEIVNFLRHLKVLTETRISECLDTSAILELVSDVLMEMETLPCNDTGSQQSFELLHVWYEVRWCMIEISFLLSSGSSNDKFSTIPEFSSQNCLEQLLKVTCLDLLYLARRKYEALNVSTNNITLLSLFSCPCIEEFWLCIFSVCKNRKIDFWSLIDFATMDGMDTADDCSVLCEYNPSLPSDEMLLMFLSSLVSLLHSSDLQLDATDQVSTCKFNKKIFKNVLKEIQSSPDELKLRTFLTVVRHVSDKTGPSLDILTDLWKYFSSELTINNSCRLKSMTLDGQTSIPASSTAWLEMIENISHLNQPTSFMIFVQICQQALVTWRNNLMEGKRRPLTPIFDR